MLQYTKQLLPQNQNCSDLYWGKNEISILGVVFCAYCFNLMGANKGEKI